MLWFYILQGIVYGFSAAVQPGPFQTYLISQALSKGWKRTLPAALAPLVSDVPIIAICLLVLSQVPVWLQRFLYIAVIKSFFLPFPATTDIGQSKTERPQKCQVIFG